MKKLTHYLFFISVFLFTGCGMFRLAKDAAKSTIEMKEKMDEMQEEMEGMSEGMERMDDRIERMEEDTHTMRGHLVDEFSELMKNMLRGIHTTITDVKSMERMVSHMLSTVDHLTPYARQAVSRDIRSDTFEKLKSVDYKIEAKLALATIYYYGFEYQTLSADERKDSEKYSQLLYATLEEFTRFVESEIPNNRSISPKFKSNKMSIVYALSAAMHKYNYLQDQEEQKPQDLAFEDDKKENPSDPPPPPLSFEDLAMAVLAVGKNLEERDTQSLPDYIREGLIWKKDVFTYLLQLRHNFITGIIIQEVSKIADVAVDHSLGFAENWNKAFMRFFPWKQNYEGIDRNSALLMEITTYVHKSIRVREFLSCVDIKPEVDGDLKEIVSNMKTGEEFKETVREEYRLFVDGHDVGEDFVEAMELMQKSVNGTTQVSCKRYEEYLNSLQLPLLGAPISL